MSNRERLALRLAQLDEDLTGAREGLGLAQERVQKLAKLQERSRDQYFETFSDEELAADEELLVKLCQASYASTKASKRIRTIVDPGVEGLTTGGYDGRDEYREKVLPGLRVTLAYRQDVEAIAAGIEAWAERFALGRPDVPVDVFEHTLSADGSWSAMYDRATKTITVSKIRYSRREELFVGGPRAALKYLAEHAWYEGGPSEDYDTDSPYDY